ncbi:hypothetical protein [Desulfovibrio sp. Fe33]|uniref:hypothetical protein n=1 Tax=Desulfovibrio sp. Fe33 TaxID=3020842 RepID=UPI00300F6544
MFKNLNLGLKLGLGFGCLILIAAVLGGVAIYNMLMVSEDSRQLAEEFVPEVGIANDLERVVLLTMYAVRGYSLSESEAFWTEGRKRLEETEADLRKAKAHADKYPRLVKLKKDVETASEGVAVYDGLVNETRRLVVAMTENRTAMDGAAAVFMKNCEDFLDSQHVALGRELDSGATTATIAERVRKIDMVNDIIHLCNSVRIRNFKSQAMRNPEVMRAAVDDFTHMREKYDTIKVVTRQSDNLRQLENIRASGDAYAEAMRRFMANFEALGELNVQRNSAAQAVLTAAQNTATAGVEAT